MPAPEVEALRQLYGALENELVTGLAQAVRGGWGWRRSQALLEQIRHRMAVLEREIDRAERAGAERQLRAGQAAAARRLEQLNLQYPVHLPVADQERWATLAEEPLRALAADIAGQRAQLLGPILRQQHDFLRQVASGQVARGVGIGKSADALARAIRDKSIEELRAGRPLQQLAEGIERACGVRYTDGSVHSLQAYGEMSARAGMARAFEAGNQAICRDAGVWLYEVSQVGTLCYICRPWEGMVGTVGEDVPGYPRLNVDIPAHPQCVHTLLPYLPAVQGPPPPLPEWLADPNLKPRDYYRRMASTPEGRQLMQWQRRGFRTEAQARRLTAQGVKFAPGYRKPGIEKLRIKATEMVVKGEAGSYREAMNRLSKKRPVVMDMAAGKDEPPKAPPAATAGTSQGPTIIVKPVSSYLVVPGAPEYGQIRSAAALMNGIHGAGSMPQTPVTIVPNLGPDGRYTVGPAPKIEIDAATPIPRLAMTHEVGHLLDEHGLGLGTRATLALELGAPAGLLEEWKQATLHTDSVRILLHMRDHGSIPMGTPGGVKDVPIDLGWAQYLAMAPEVWARSYAQYISLRTGDAALRAELVLMRNQLHTDMLYYPMQWEDDEFEPVAAAIDKLLAGLGWLK